MPLTSDMFEYGIFASFPSEAGFTYMAGPTEVQMHTQLFCILTVIAIL